MRVHTTPAHAFMHIKQSTTRTHTLRTLSASAVAERRGFRSYRTRRHSELHSPRIKVRSFWPVESTAPCPTPRTPPLSSNTHALEGSHPCSVPREAPLAIDQALSITHSAAFSEIVLTCSRLALVCQSTAHAVHSRSRPNTCGPGNRVFKVCQPSERSVIEAVP